MLELLFLFRRLCGQSYCAASSGVCNHEPSTLPFRWSSKLHIMQKPWLNAELAPGARIAQDSSSGTVCLLTETEDAACPTLAYDCLHFVRRGTACSSLAQQYRNLVVRRGVRSRQAASIGCPQALLDGDLPFRQPQDCLPRGDASVSRSQTCFDRNLLSQDDQKVSRKEMYALKDMFSIELTIFKLTKHDCRSRR